LLACGVAALTLVVRPRPGKLSAVCALAAANGNGKFERPGSRRLGDVVFEDLHAVMFAGQVILAPPIFTVQQTRIRESHHRVSAVRALSFLISVETNPL